MASQQPPPPAVRTTITALADDLLREILLRLPDLPSLVRAAFACRAFRRAVRSSRAFRRSFRALHAPPLLALFLEPNMEAVPVLPSQSLRVRSDPGLLSADFFRIRHTNSRATGWEIQSWNPSGDGYLLLSLAGSTKRRAAYSPLTHALDLLLYQPDDITFQLHTLSSQDGQGPPRVVCVRLDHRLAETTAFVFSSDTMEWQISRKATVRLPGPHSMRTSMVVRGLICWRGWMYQQIVVLDTATCRFSLIDLPTPLKTEDEPTYRLGETKDEKLCIVDIQGNTLVSWFMKTNDDTVVDRWMTFNKFSLHPIVERFTGCLIGKEGFHFRADLVAVIEGFVYLSIFYRKDKKYFELYLSISLETSEISVLFNGAYRHNEEAHPYVMAWPPSLLQSKTLQSLLTLKSLSQEESQTEITGDSVADDGLVCTEEASTVLVTALQSFRQALMDDSDSNKEIVAELDAFLGPTYDDEGSLIRKMATLDAQLRTARDRILRIRA